MSNLSQENGPNSPNDLANTGHARAAWSRAKVRVLICAAAVLISATGAQIAQAQPFARPGPSLIAPGEAGDMFLYRGVHYCWSEQAWRGPGWYRCGYEWQTGLGWGGRLGWLGWRPPHHHHHHFPHRPPPHHPGKPPAPHHPAPPAPGGPRPGGPSGGPPRPRG